MEPDAGVGTAQRTGCLAVRSGLHVWKESNRQGCAGAREKRSGHANSSKIFQESPRGVGELGRPASEAICSEENREDASCPDVSFEEMDPTRVTSCNL